MAGRTERRVMLQRESSNQERRSSASAAPKMSLHIKSFVGSIPPTDKLAGTQVVQCVN